ncbi:MAG: divergent polysaccharide deacetylase family protein [Alphaproteobacteria bacterium]|nr:divergent polysaccharide deacetylase family protein [Alphaproteobacteria bacterium]
MSAVSSTDEPQGSRSARALAFASAFVACGLAGGALAITVLGRHHSAAVSLELPAPAPAKKAAAFVPAQGDAQSDDGAVLPPVTKPVYAGKALLADPALIQNTKQGPLPRVAEDGRTPMQAYAAPAADGKARIAIVVRGLGISASATKAALDSLPAGVTLAFAPYAQDVSKWVAEARARGHEVLLEVPMEPYDFPDSDPGPHTLRAGQGEGTNMDRLTWALTRITGYAGVTNLMGQRFLSDSDALSPVLTYLSRHGLYFFDNGSATQSVAPLVAGQVGAPLVQSNAAIDTIQTALEIDHRLSDLETSARANGSATGSAFLYPVSLSRIAAWAKDLKSRGFVLVPVSAIVKSEK